MSQNVDEIAKDLVVALLGGNGNEGRDGRWVAEQYRVICQAVGEASRKNGDDHVAHHRR